MKYGKQLTCVCKINRKVSFTLFLDCVCISEGRVPTFQRTSQKVFTLVYFINE